MQCYTKRCFSVKILKILLKISPAAAQRHFPYSDLVTTPTLLCVGGFPPILITLSPTNAKSYVQATRRQRAAWSTQAGEAAPDPGLPTPLRPYRSPVAIALRLFPRGAASPSYSACGPAPFFTPGAEAAGIAGGNFSRRCPAVR